MKFDLVLSSNFLTFGPCTTMAATTKRSYGKAFLLAHLSLTRTHVLLCTAVACGAYYNKRQIERESQHGQIPVYVQQQSRFIHAAVLQALCYRYYCFTAAVYKYNCCCTLLLSEQQYFLASAEVLFIPYSSIGMLVRKWPCDSRFRVIGV